MIKYECSTDFMTNKMQHKNVIGFSVSFAQVCSFINQFIKIEWRNSEKKEKDRNWITSKHPSKATWIVWFCIFHWIGITIFKIKFDHNIINSYAFMWKIFFKRFPRKNTFTNMKCYFPPHNLSCFYQLNGVQYSTLHMKIDEKEKYH